MASLEFIDASAGCAGQPIDKYARGVRWMVTLFPDSWETDQATGQDYVENRVLDARDSGLYSCISACWERCPTTQRIHAHIYLECKPGERVSFTTVKNSFHNTAHIDRVVRLLTVAYRDSSVINPSVRRRSHQSRRTSTALATRMTSARPTTLLTSWTGASPVRPAKACPVSSVRSSRNVSTLLSLLLSQSAGHWTSKSSHTRTNSYVKLT